jgi:hypothetical protein
MAAEYGVVTQAFSVSIGFDLDRSSKDAITNCALPAPPLAGRALIENVGRGITD